MKTVRSGIIGLLLALCSGLLVLGALSYAILEGTVNPQMTATPRPTLPLPNLTPLGMLSDTPMISTGLPTSLPSSSTCPPPAGWQVYLIQPGDELSQLAAERGIKLAEILQGNCLVTSMVLPDTSIYLPPLAAASPTATTPSLTPTYTWISCGPPYGWTLYTVRVGDTLTQISRLYRVSVWQLKAANCLVGDLIRAGSKLWVPNVATSTFTSTTTPTRRPARPNPTSTGTFTLTPVPTAVPSDTPLPTAVATETFTDTSLPPETPTFTAVDTDTDTPVPVDTQTDTPEPSGSGTSEATSTSN